jgi:hypothetical protein
MNIDSIHRSDGELATAMDYGARPMLLRFLLPSGWGLLGHVSMSERC